MFLVTVYNKKTKEKYSEIVKDQKRLDALAESLYTIYGNDILMDISQIEEEVQTKRYSQIPECPVCINYNINQTCNICGSVFIDVD